MHYAYDFPNRPPSTLEELWRWVTDLLPQLQPRISRRVSLTTSQTVVPHGLGAIPRLVNWIAHDDSYCWHSADPDERFVYLTASAAADFDLEFVK